MAQLKKEGKKLLLMLSGLAEPKESMEFRMNITTEDFRAYGQKIIDALTPNPTTPPGGHCAPDNYEVIRPAFDKNDGDGWFLLRLSVHDPLMPLNIESDSEGGVRIIARKLCDFLEKYEYLDTAPLKEWLAE